MKTVYKALTLVAVAAAMASCQKGETSGRSGSISLGSYLYEGTSTRAGETEFDRNLQPLFLFWTDGNFNDNTKNAPDFFTRIPEGEIDSYAIDKYNTKVYYPLYDRTVHAVGLAPSPGEKGLAFKTEGDYSEFVIPRGYSEYADDEHGAYDILVSNNVEGKDSAPIATPLIFRHALTQISFSAILAPSMSQFVKFITIEFPGSSAPLAVKWNDNDSVYEVIGGADGSDDFVAGNFWTLDGSSLAQNDSRANYTQFFQLNKTRAQQVAKVCIIPPHASSIPVTIRYKMVGTVGGFDTPDPQNPIRDIEKQMSLNFVDSNGDPVELKAGDAYSIVLSFNVYDIELIGKLRDWQDGGYISLPFQPTR